MRLAFINFHLRFRGPDYTGTKQIGGFDFVHNLLHMTGAFTPQPFVSADNGTLALFNGEIYNFRTLQQELRPSGRPYRSDGECVLEAYHTWGEEFASHFDGEFAIAVFDLHRRQILVSTDVFGIKPLFVAMSDEAFGVSSYRSGLERAGHPAASISQLDANRVYIYSFEASTGPDSQARPHSFRLLRSREGVSWDLRQHKVTTDAWEGAFEEAVRKRTPVRRWCDVARG